MYRRSALAKALAQMKIVFGFFNKHISGSMDAVLHVQFDRIYLCLHMPHAIFSYL